MLFFSKKEKWLTDDPRKADKAIASLKKAGWEELLRASLEAPVKEVADAASGILMDRLKNEPKDSPFFDREALKAIAARGSKDIAIEALKRNMWHVEDEVYVAEKTPHPAVALQIVGELAKSKILYDKELKMIAISPDGHDEARLLAVKNLESKKILEEVENKAPSEAVRNVASAKMALIREAEDPETSPKRLAELEKKEKISGVRNALAHNPSTPVPVLRELAKNVQKGSIIEYGLAANPSTPPEILADIFKTGGWLDDTTRYCLAGNPSTPQGTLKKLAADEEGYIRELAKKNPNYKGH